MFPTPVRDLIKGPYMLEGKTFTHFCSMMLAVAMLLMPLQFAEALEVKSGPNGDIYVLRFASPNGARSPFGIADRAWMNKITQESGGRIQFQTFWRSTLISQHSAIEELEAGVADVAVIHPTFTRAGMHGIKGQMSFYAGVQDRGNKPSFGICGKVTQNYRMSLPMLS